jgi:hypothetical protein
MRKLILAALLTLSACGTSLTTPLATTAPAATAKLALACKVDATVQPIAAATVQALVPAATPAVDVDTLVVHPAVVALCASVGGTPVAVAQTVVTVAASNPTVAATLTKVAPAIAKAETVANDASSLTAAAVAAAASK